MAYKSSTVRFGVDLDRKVEADFAEIARSVEKRPKVDLHRRVVGRIVRMWRDNPDRLIEFGLIQRGE